VLTDGLDWRWIFLVNLPISGLALMSCLALRPDGPVRRGRFDVAGLVTFTIAATALTLAVIRSTPSLYVVSAVTLAVFVLIERRSAVPMIDLALLRNRTFTGVLIAALLVNFAAFAVLTYTSICGCSR
jgi:hypothetical protein